MKKSYVVLFIVMMLCLSYMPSFASSISGSVSHTGMLIQGKSINVATINFNDPDIRFDVVKGNNTVAGWEEFSSIINRTKPVAAINGNYFNAYATDEIDIRPWGYIYQDGKQINSGATLNRGSFAVTYDREIIINNGEAFPKDNIETMVEAGPLLILNGKIVYDPSTSGFTEDKINLNPAQRSAIGVKEDGKVVMVTGSNLRMTELAAIMYELECVAATNLDGGASSALYANGTYLTNPGRKLNTVLVVHDDQAQQNNYEPVTEDIQIYVNGKKLALSVPPMIVNSRTMVPVSAISQALEAEVEWDAVKRQVHIRQGEVTLVLMIDSITAVVDNSIVTLEAPAMIAHSRTYVPLSFIANAFDADISWDAATRSVFIETE